MCFCHIRLTPRASRLSNAIMSIVSALQYPISHPPTVLRFKNRQRKGNVIMPNYIHLPVPWLEMGAICKYQTQTRNSHIWRRLCGGDFVFGGAQRCFLPIPISITLVGMLLMRCCRRQMEAVVVEVERTRRAWHNNTVVVGHTWS